MEKLFSDNEFLIATRRELHQCATECEVESIKGNQSTKAIFTLRPLEKCMVLYTFISKLNSFFSYNQY